MLVDVAVLGGRSPPLACIFGTSRLYFTCTPPVSHRILGISCIPVSILYLSILQQIHCITLYPTISSCIRTYLAISSCIPLYLTVSHCLENGTWPTIQSRGGLVESGSTSALSGVHGRRFPDTGGGIGGWIAIDIEGGGEP